MLILQILYPRLEFFERSSFSVFLATSGTLQAHYLTRQPALHGKCEYVGFWSSEMTHEVIWGKVMVSDNQEIEGDDFGEEPWSPRGRSLDRSGSSLALKSLPKQNGSEIKENGSWENRWKFNPGAHWGVSKTWSEQSALPSGGKLEPYRRAALQSLTDCGQGRVKADSGVWRSWSVPNLNQRDIRIKSRMTRPIVNQLFDICHILVSMTSHFPLSPVSGQA